MQYHYTDQDNQVLGPVSDEELQALYRSGTITADSNVFPEGDTDWRPYRTIASIPAPPPSNLAPVIHTPKVVQTRIAPAPTVAATQKCPFCAEDISINAKKCKHCGETIDVALRAAEEAKRANANPLVFMNAGGGGSSAAAAAATNTRPSVVVVGNRKSGFVAAILNLLIPGLGYMYCGRFFLGVFAFIATAGIIIGTAGAGALVMYPLVFIDGFLAAGRANRKVIVVS